MDAHASGPPEALRAAWKRLSRSGPVAVLAADGPIDDPQASGSGFEPAAPVTTAQQNAAFACVSCKPADSAAAVFAHPRAPGLLVVPALLPPCVQTALLALLLHRDLANPAHSTNLDAHYRDPTTPAPAASLFALDPDTGTPFVPRDPATHAPLTPRAALDRRLHWLTLGAQYDWTRRAYAPGPSPPLPADLAALVVALFPTTPRPDAAIINVYRAGDTMGLHRDDAEPAAAAVPACGLVSLSLGNDGLFMIAAAGDRPFLLLRLRSGDAVYMAGPARLAWHGMLRVVPDTCPAFLRNWPAFGAEYGPWRGWMSDKRVNLNVRQTLADDPAPSSDDGF